MNTRLLSKYLFLVCLLALTAFIIPRGQATAHVAQTGVIQRISISNTGTQGNNASTTPAMSADGRYIAFESGSDTFDARDTNGHGDVYLYDRAIGTITWISDLNMYEEGCGNPDITPDGTYVVFSCGYRVSGTNDVDSQVVVYDHNNTVQPYITITTNANGQLGNDDSLNASISTDGRYVVFESAATNLAPGNVLWRWSVMVHDRNTGNTKIVSINSKGEIGNALSYNASISANGRYVAFESAASNLVEGDTNGIGDVFLHDRDTNENGIFDESQAVSTTRISVASDGSQGNMGGELWRSNVISSDGRYIVFTSRSTNLGGNPTDSSNVYLYDRQTLQTTLISTPYDTTRRTGCSAATFSYNARYITFKCSSDNIIPGDTNGRIDIFVHDRNDNRTTRISLAADGSNTNDHSHFGSTSDDGRYVVFSSYASNLVPNDTNGHIDVFLWDKYATSPTATPAPATPTITPITGPDATPPTGEITAPTEGDTYGLASMIIQATASDNSGGSGVKEVGFFVQYDGKSHLLGVDSTSPYEMGWDMPPLLRSQVLRFSINITDNAGNVSSKAGGERQIYFVESQGSTTVRENWISSRFYLNQRSLSPVGDWKCNVASMAMLLASLGEISPAQMAEKSNEMYEEVLDADGYAYVSKMRIALIRRGIQSPDKYDGVSLDSISVNAGWEVIKKEIDFGRPVIVDTMPGVMTEAGHFIVAVGYRETTTEKEVIVYDPFGKWKGTLNQYDANFTANDSSKGKWVRYEYQQLVPTTNFLIVGIPQQSSFAHSLSTITPPDEVSAEPENPVEYLGAQQRAYFQIFTPLLMK